MNDRSIALVFGYIPNIDAKNRLAEKAKLFQKISIAMDSHRAFSDDMYFDVDLFVQLLKRSLQAVQSDAFELLDTTKHSIPYASVDELGAGILSSDLEEHPIFQLRVFFRGNLVGLGEMTYYTAVGGPAPYHDTYTFSLYFAAYDRDAILARLEAFCTASDVVIREVVTANARPQRTIGYFLKWMLR